MPETVENENEEVVISMPLNGPSLPPTSEDTPPEDAQQPDNEETNKGCSAEDIVILVLTVFICIVVVPLYVLYVLAAYMICEIDVTEDSKPKKEKQGKNELVYQKVQECHDAALRVANLVSVIRIRIVFIMQVWLVINLYVPGLRRKKVLGSPLWKWSLLVFIIACGYIAISIVTHLMLYFLTKLYKGGKDGGYFLRELRRSVNVIVFSATVFLLWHFYFLSNRGLRDTSHTHGFFDYMTWTMVALLIFSVLWLVKAILLLQWEAHAVYHRFTARILRAGFQLYFLAIIAGISWDTFRPAEEEEADQNGEEGKVDEKEKMEGGENQIILERKPTMDQINAEEEKKKKEREDGKRKAKDILMLSSKDVTTYRLKRMANYFLSLAKESSREDDDISHLQSKCREIEVMHCEYITVDDLSKFQLEEYEKELLYKELQGNPPSEKVTYAMFEKWMVRAHKYCLALGYTLTDAKGVVDCLNQLMSGSVIAVVILAWLLLTGIATTKVLIAIVSPFLAATFVFGDTCKTLFEGIIFAFVKHPFDVGDRCIIDGIEMEVKRMNILTTIFLKMSPREETFYPNSVLATKPIVNLKGEPDPSDSVELNLDCATEKSKIDALKDKIRHFLDDSDHAPRYESPCHITVKEIGSGIKMDVRFKHSMSILDVTHAQCSEKKRKQRSEFLLHVKQFLENLQIKIASA
ncbi:hypothetical protein Ancab_012134 [Ancistrocladus abbreviatus]